MICESCMIAADLDMQQMHCGSYDCMCHHQPTARIKSNRVECAWCGKKVSLTPVGRVMHYHNDNRYTKFNKWGLKCPGSGKVNPDDD